MRKSPPKSRPLHRWRITQIKSKGQELGTVSAATAEDAIKVAIAQFQVKDPQQQQRLAAYRLS